MIFQAAITMHFEAVLVSLRAQISDQTCRTSGILFNRNLVLISGASLIPLVEQEKWISSFINSSSPELKTNKYVQNITFRVFVECKRNNSNERASKKIQKLNSKPVGVWKCPLVSESMKNLFYDWTLGFMHTDNETGSSLNDRIHSSKELISVFILLKCEGERDLKVTKRDDDIRAFSELIMNVKKPKRGHKVGILSTPFGNEFFMNSLSRGVISNVVGCYKCIILCDARTVSGCEGGPIFITEKSWKQEEKHMLLGVVTCPFSWWRGEWVGLTLGISLLPVLKRLFKREDKTCWENLVENALTTYNSDLSAVDFIDETVVFIRSKTSWGAGVILNAASGIIITCSHVVTDSNTVSVVQKGNYYTANVVFKSQNDIAYDLAVIKTEINPEFITEAKFSQKPAKVGETVTAAGFPFFSERDDVCARPSIVTGCVARVNPHMIQTTCCIQSGFSGGALLRDRELLGIVISNAKDSTAGALFPHINFVVPSSVFKDPVQKYIKTNDATYLKELESPDIWVQALWQLQSSKL